ncbi:MAG: sensor histidine kinase [Jiangellaceae bacterium]
MIAAVLVVAALGMALAGATSYFLQRQRVDARIDDALAQEVSEFRALAASGVDPRTGEPFTTVEGLFFIALQRNIPDRHEGLLAMIDGQVELVPPQDVELRPERDAGFVDLLRAAPADASVRIADTDTSLGALRYVAIPVRVEGDPADGLYVITYARDLEQAAVVDVFRTYAAVCLVALAVIGAVGLAVAGRLLQPVRLLNETAQRVSETDLSQRIPASGRDDLSQLARTVNAMLGRLEAAFAMQRQFLDDAGHELRTPITIVRGHLELMDPTDSADVAETRALALDELDRMQRLVDDLVLLAKAKRPDFIRTEPVEVDRLTDDVMDKARPLVDRDWGVDARVHATLELDGQRITQALLQLIANAVRFTTPGQTIAIGSRISDGVLHLWVRDTGPGVAPEDAERIFERFGRAATGRGGEGSGLGLAIVRAIAEAHNGRVVLHSTVGQGATFVIEIPVAGRTLDDSTVPLPTVGLR